MDPPATEISFSSTPPSNPSTPQVTYLVFFICGNPGLIEYYRTFLAHLSSGLSSSTVASTSRLAFTVYGRSLAGFEVDNQPHRSTLKLKSGSQISTPDIKYRSGPPYGLQEQIELVERNLHDCVRRHQGGKKGQSRLRVILIGHSVGAYIALEVLRRSRQRAGLRIRQQPDGSGEKENGAFKDALGGDTGRIVGAVCLFPTVIDIARSRSGKTLNLLSSIPLFSTVAPLIAKVLVACTHRRVLSTLIRWVLSMPVDAARTTTAFLKSKFGVRQALLMGCDEVRTITADKWDSEIWGTAERSHSSVPVSKLFFYFAEKDHWVADRTRDDLIRMRGRRRENGALEPEEDGNQIWKPKMEIDGEGVSHGFCIRHSARVARKVIGYVEEIVAADMKLMSVSSHG